MPSSLPLTLSGLGPLPQRLPRDAWIVVVGVADGAGGPKATRERAESKTVAWLARVVGPALASGRARLWTVCSGALLAARAGLLDGRQCTTHHSLIDALARACPAARVLANRIFVADGPVATSAGITAGIDLALFAVGEKLGQPLALAVARELVVYHRRAGGDPQLSPWLQHRNHLHAAVHRAQDAVLAAPASPWNVSTLAAAAHVSPRHLARLFHDNAGIAPLDYLHRIRVELAGRLLREGDLTIERVAEHAGFSSAHHLRRVWRRFHAVLPSAVRQ
jgi:transcriptional regulator GlxA family with amidase domain